MIDPRDGQRYPVVTFSGEIAYGVQITQTWMASNLNYFDKAVIGQSWCYEENEKNCAQYGRLYSWEAARRACPPGWHLPSDVEWQRLIHQFTQGGLTDAQAKLAYEQLSEYGQSGFRAQLGGYRHFDSGFYSIGQVSYYWTSTELANGKALRYRFSSEEGELRRGDNEKNRGNFCRCIRD